MPGTPPGVPGQPLTPVPTPMPMPSSPSASAQHTTPPSRRSGGRWIAATASGVAVAAAIGGILALALSHGNTSSTGTLGGGGSVTAPASASRASSSPTVSSSPAASSSVTAASSPTATSSLIAVTVCTEPADGCTLAGASQYMEVKPNQITTSGDGSAYVDKITWSSWGGSEETGAGTLELNNCNPSCAQGTYTGYPATVTLDGLKPYGTGLEAYSTIVVQSPSAPSDSNTYTYTTGTVP
jgi:hypothetical protein